MSHFEGLAWFVTLSLFVFIVSKLNIREFMDNKRLQHRLFGASTILFLLWLFRVSVQDGLILQFLGLSAFTLALGFRWSMVAGILTLFLSNLVAGQSILSFGVYAIAGVIVPICFSYIVYMVSFHKVPRHVFSYIFICGFFPGGISIALKMLLLSAYFWLAGIYEWPVIYQAYTQLTWLLMFQEAFFNGMLVTCLVVYKPKWLYTYHDKFYLDGK